MAKYSIADFIVDIQNRFEYLEKQCVEYACKEDASAEFTIRVTDEELRQERLSSDAAYSNGYLESVCAYRRLCLDLPLRDALLLHGSVIAYKGRGIAFLARSGVGKSTHTLLWKSAYGDAVSIINGDKPIVRFVNGTPYAYGTPWAGKEGLQQNTSIPLTDLCFIERSAQNEALRADGAACLDALMGQVLHPSESRRAIKTLELVDALTKHCRLWVIRCNTTQQAAQTAHDAIFGGMKE